MSVLTTESLPPSLAARLDDAQRQAVLEAPRSQRLDLRRVGIADDEMPAEDRDVLIAGQDDRQPVQGLVGENEEH